MKRPSFSKVVLSQIASVLIAIALFALAFGPNLPYTRFAPGTAYDAAGKYDGKEVIDIQSISNLPTYDVHGRLLMLTVTEWGAPYGRLSWFDALRSVWDPAIAVHPAEFIYPNNVDYEKQLQEGYVDINLSKQQALGAVFRYLKYSVNSHLRVDILETDFPAIQHLKLGDVLVSINGSKLTTYEDIYALRKTFKEGVATNWVVKRKGKEVSFSMAPVDDGYGSLVFGLKFQEIYETPMKITWNLDSVGGPSGGLAFALSLYEKWSAEDLFRGRTIAATGAIAEEDGWIDAIGGIDQKLALAARNGATLMLIPGMNCSDISAPIPPELTVVPVYHLSEAIDILRQKSTKYPTCEEQT